MQLTSDTGLRDETLALSAKAGNDLGRRITRNKQQLDNLKNSLDAMANSNQGFTQSFAETGWTKLPNGLILQWGKIRKTNGMTSIVRFPIVFPVAVTMLSFSFDGYPSYRNLTKVSFDTEATRDMMYFAIGY